MVARRINVSINETPRRSQQRGKVIYTHTTNTQRSIALTTLHECVKDADEHHSQSPASFVWPKYFACLSPSPSTSSPVFLSILVIVVSIYIPMCTYLYLYILCIFIQSNIVAETCQTHIDEAISWEVVGAKGQSNTGLHGYSSLHYNGTGDKAQYSGKFWPIPLYSWFIEIVKAIISWLAAADLKAVGATVG